MSKRFYIIAGVLLLVMLFGISGILVAYDSAQKSKLYDENETPIPINPLPTQLLPTAEKLLSVPRSLPEFVARLEPSPGQTVRTINCVYIELWQGALWQPGDETQKLDDYLGSRVHLILDTQDIPIPKSLLGFSGPEYFEYSKKTLIATHGGSFDACLPVTLAPGLHMATVEVTDTSKNKHSYSWAFRVG